MAENNENYWVKVSSWGGLGTPTSRDMTIGPDGHYLIRINAFAQIDNPSAIVETKEGNLSPEQMDELKKFVEEHVVKNSLSMIFDAGFTVKVKRDDKVTEVKNDLELFTHICKLVPFNTK